MTVFALVHTEPTFRPLIHFFVEASEFNTSKATVQPARRVEAISSIYTGAQCACVIVAVLARGTWGYSRLLMFCKITLKGELLCTLGSFSLRTSPSILPPVLTGFSRPCNTKAPWHDAHLGDYVSLHTATPGGTARVMRSTVFFLQSRRKKKNSTSSA